MRARGLARCAQYLLVLAAAVSVNFALPHLAPGDPVEYLYGGDDAGLTPAQLEALRGQYGLDAPVFEQYLRFWGSLLRGDLGTSVEYNRPVLDILAERAGWTALLVGLGLVLAYLIGTLLGAWAGWRRGRRGDRASVAAVLALDSMPGFWIGMILLAIFSVRLGWFPSFGVVPLDSGGLDRLLDVAARTVLPASTLALAMAGTFFLLARASMGTVLEEPHVRFARARGLSDRRVALRHGLRTALLPGYTKLATELGAVLSGSVVVETVFAYPGLGQLIYRAVLVRDYPLLQGAFLLSTLAIVGANLVADLTYPWLDPRVRRGGSRSRAIA
ncbi:MAG: ABC transporter permease [Sporichthyaceae bacterium]